MKNEIESKEAVQRLEVSQMFRNGLLLQIPPWEHHMENDSFAYLWADRANFLSVIVIGGTLVEIVRIEEQFMRIV